VFLEAEVSQVGLEEEGSLSLLDSFGEEVASEVQATDYIAKLSHHQLSLERMLSVKKI
jgi:hypothetical protein